MNNHKNGASTIIYSRMSLPNQINGLENQIQICRDYCRDNNLPSPVIEQKKCSNGKTFTYLVNRIKKTDGTVNVIATSLDRLTRNLTELEHLNKLQEIGKVNLHIVNTQNRFPLGYNNKKQIEEELFQSIRQSFADYERKIISQKVKAGLARRKALLENQKAVALTTASSKTTK
jgi:DNA invertase Pin-like site-specific DNA recombinase